MIRTNAREQRLDVRIDRVIAPDRDAAPTARGDLGRGLVDRARHTVGGRRSGRASTGDVDGRAGRSELERDATAGATAGPRDESDHVMELRHWPGLTSHADSTRRAACRRATIRTRPEPLRVRSTHAPPPPLPLPSRPWR